MIKIPAVQHFWFLICALSMVFLTTCKESPAFSSRQQFNTQKQPNSDTLQKHSRDDNMTFLDTADYLLRWEVLQNDTIKDMEERFNPIPKAGAILPFYRIIAMYGNFYSRHMGILGRVSEEDLINLLKLEMLEWKKADTLTKIIPAIHYIAITAQSKPGKNNLYRLHMPEKQIQKAILLSKKVDGLTFLDIQVGHSTVQKEISYLEKYLLDPMVHLGLDPEWSMKDGSIPGNKIGTMDAADINYAISFLSALVKKNNLPPKILVIHRFTKGMITNYKKIKPTPEVQVVINMDGFGFPAKKIDSYKRFVGGMPVQFTGFKLFYKNDKHDKPYRLMTPTEILKLKPKPIYIQYQ